MKQNKESFFSLRWKLLLALVLSGLTLVLIYVFVAKQVFENDKISYVFESQNNRIGVIRRDIQGRYDKILLVARSIVASYDFSLQQVLPIGKSLFKSEPLIASVQLIDEKSKQVLFQLNQDSESLSPLNNLEIKPVTVNEVLVYFEKEFAIFQYRPFENPENFSVVRLAVPIKDFLGQNDYHQPLMFLSSQKNKTVDTQATVYQQYLNQFENSLIEEITSVFQSSSQSMTQLWHSRNINKEYLVSTTSLPFGGLVVLSFSSKEQALGALNTLFARSIIFIIFSVFGLTLISIFLAKSMTFRLGQLAIEAEQIGQGKFDQVAEIKSSDEIGILSKAFQKMVIEIQRLLRDTEDKARMESELKTARLVQESLMPKEEQVVFDQLQVHGLALTSTECGGDWWHYFKQKDFVYVAIADATGHGTPAALITAAARSIFSKLEKSHISLYDMMLDWDAAVSSCSNNKVFMTGILMRVNLKTFLVEYIGAGHEAPYFIRHTKSDGSFEAEVEPLDLKIYPTLGEGWGDDLDEVDDMADKSNRVNSIQLEPGSGVILYTDGLFAIERPEGPKLSERRFLKMLNDRLAIARSAELLTEGVLQTFNDYRKDLPLPDDVTIASLYRIEKNS